MAPPTVFTRPKRQILSTTGTARLTREVRCESQLLVAIAELSAPRAGFADLDIDETPTGGEIVIAAPFTIGATIVVPPEGMCITFRSAGYAAITPRVAISSMFLVEAAAVSFIALFCSAAGLSSCAETFVRIGSVGGTAGKDITVERCIVIADRVFVDEHGATNAIISRNRQTELSATHAAAIVCLNPCLIEGNTLADGGGDSITLGAFAQGSRIIGNHTGGGDITTTAATDGSTIVGNVMGGGAITANAGDAVGLNA
jgi:hypothetical protein